MTLKNMAKVLADLDEFKPYKEGTDAELFMSILGMSAAMAAIAKYETNEQACVYRAASLALEDELDALVEKMEAEAHGRC